MTTKTTHKHDHDEKPKLKAVEKKDDEQAPDAEPIHLMHQRIESEADGKK